MFNKHENVTHKSSIRPKKIIEAGNVTCIVLCLSQKQLTTLRKT